MLKARAAEGQTRLCHCPLGYGTSSPMFLWLSPPQATWSCWTNRGCACRARSMSLRGDIPSISQEQGDSDKKMNFYLSSLFLLGLFHPVMALSRRDATGMEPHWWQGHAGWGWKLMAAGCLNDFGNQGRGGWHSVGFGTACSLACSPVWHSS